MTTYRTAIIGLSWIATDPPPAASDPVLGTSIPYSHAAALAAVPNVEVVAGCDINPAMREQFVERWRRSLAGRDDLRELPRDARGDQARHRLDRHAGLPARRPIPRGHRARRARHLLRQAARDQPRGRGPDGRGGQGGRHRREHQLHAALDPAVREREGDPAVRAHRRPRPDHRRDRRPAGDAVPQPHPPRRPALLLRRRGARVGLGRARARVTRTTGPSTRATAARPSRPSPPRTTTSRSRTACARSSRASRRPSPTRS